MAVRKRETFPPVTMEHIRGHGCRELLIYCGSGRCHHGATMNADWLPDETPVRSLCRRMVPRPRSGLIAAPDPFTTTHRRVLMRAAERYRLPAVYGFRQFVTEGALMS
jgi:hypothetical protein